MAMAARAFPLSSSRSCWSLVERPSDTPSPRRPATAWFPTGFRGVRAKAGAGEGEKPKKKKSSKQSLFGSVAEALDFSQVRSSEDALLLEEATDATRSGGRMSREQYGALRRKIGGTYKDFFKSYVDVEGQYVEDGWVDKTCRICKKDTRGEPRQVDKLGRYAHTACLERSKPTNFFSKFFSR